MTTEAKKGQEFWIDVYGYEGIYQISNLGSVRSKNKVLKAFNEPKEYVRIQLCKDKNRKTHFVHRLVARAFIGEIPKGMHVCHINGNRHDNRLINLKIATPLENNKDKIAHGTHRYGTKSSKSKLTSDQVSFIRYNYRKRTPGAKSNSQVLADKFFVSRRTIQEIISGRTHSYE